jgi:hypothetical protein
MSEKHLTLDPDAPPSEEELAEAKKLRDALDQPAPAEGDAQLARALSAAWSPTDLPAEAHRVLVDRALAAHLTQRRRRRVVRASFGAGALVALAAGFAVVVGIQREPPVASTAVAYLSTRSTQALFSGPFPRTGGETARVDRIAVARAADLRENEFAKWGVR